MCRGVYAGLGAGVYVNGLLCGAGFECTSTVPFSPGTGSRFSIMGGRPCRASGTAGAAVVSRSCSGPGGCTATAPTMPAVSTKAAAVPVTIKRLRTLSSPCGFRYCLVPICGDASVFVIETRNIPRSAVLISPWTDCRTIQRRCCSCGVPDGTIRGRTPLATGTCNTRSTPVGVRRASRSGRQNVRTSATRNADLLTFCRTHQVGGPGRPIREGERVPPLGGSAAGGRPLAWPP